MEKTNARPKLAPFDAAGYLTDDAAVAEYMTAVLAKPCNEHGDSAQASWQGHGPTRGSKSL